VLPGAKDNSRFSTSLFERRGTDACSLPSFSSLSSKFHQITLERSFSPSFPPLRHPLRLRRATAPLENLAVTLLDHICAVLAAKVNPSPPLWFTFSGGVQVLALSLGIGDGQDELFSPFLLLSLQAPALSVMSVVRHQLPLFYLASVREKETRGSPSSSFCVCLKRVSDPVFVPSTSFSFFFF